MKGGTRKRGKTWSYYFDAAAVGGKRKKIEKGGFRTKKEAEAALAKALSEYNRAGMVFEPSNISVGDYLDEWLEQYVKPNLTTNTLDNYTQLIRTHVIPVIGAYRLSTIQTATIQKLLNSMKEKGYSKSTVSSIKCILSGAFGYAVEPLHYIQINPCKTAKIGKFAVKKRTRVIVPKESYAEIINLFPFGSYEHILLMLGWNCGLRIGECLALSWDCVDLEAKTIQIKYQRVQGSNGWVLKSPKYDSARTLQISDSLCAMLKAEKHRQIGNEILYGEYYTIYESEPINQKNEIHLYGVKKSEQEQNRISFVCIRDNGVWVGKNDVSRISKKIREAILPEFDYHSLRHTHATMLVTAGVNIKAVQQRLGHRDIATTLNTYAHCTDSMEREAVEAFEKLCEKILPPM